MPSLNAKTFTAPVVLAHPTQSVNDEDDTSLYA